MSDRTLGQITGELPWMRADRMREELTYAPCRDDAAHRRCLKCTTAATYDRLVEGAQP